MKRIYAILLISVLAICLISAGFAAEGEKAAAKKPLVKKPAVTQAARGGPGQAMRPMMRPSMSMVFGTVVKVTDADPNNATLEVKDSATNQTRVIKIMPWTSVTKITDVSELKAGEAVRVVARRGEDEKDLAMSVAFGKVGHAPRMPGMAPEMGPGMAPEMLPQGPMPPGMGGAERPDTEDRPKR